MKWSSPIASAKCLRVGCAKTQKRENIRVCPALLTAANNTVKSQERRNGDSIICFWGPKKDITKPPSSGIIHIIYCIYHSLGNPEAQRRTKNPHWHPFNVREGEINGLGSRWWVYVGEFIMFIDKFWQWTFVLRTAMEKLIKKCFY